MTVALYPCHVGVLAGLTHDKLFRQDTAKGSQHKHLLVEWVKKHRFLKGEGYTETLLPLLFRAVPLACVIWHLWCAISINMLPG